MDSRTVPISANLHTEQIIGPVERGDGQNSKRTDHRYKVKKKFVKSSKKWFFCSARAKTNHTDDLT